MHIYRYLYTAIVSIHMKASLILFSVSVVIIVVHIALDIVRAWNI